MALLERISAAYRALTEGPYRLSDDGAVTLFASSSNSVAGVAVNEDTAMAHAAVYACVRLISQQIASLPLDLYRREGDDGREYADGHELNQLFRFGPNPNMTSIVWRETMIAHLLLWGNHYSEIKRDGGGRVKALIPIHPARVNVECYSKGGVEEIIYRVTPPNGQQRMLRRQEMFHPLGVSMDGLKGMSVIAANRETIGLGIALGRYGSAFFGNGARPGGILTHPTPLKPEQKKRLKESWEEAHTGADRGHKLAVLDGDMKYQAISVNPEDAQYLELRKFSVEDVARIFGVPLVLVQSTEKSTSWGSGIEHLMIGFRSQTLRPTMIRIEQEIHRKLLLDGEREDYYAEHNDAALLRGDLKSRYEAYSLGRNGGWLSINDIRAFENLDRISEPVGDEYGAPANIAGGKPSPEGNPPAGDEPKPAEPANEDKSAGVIALLEPVVRRQLELLVDREVKAVRKGLDGRSAAEFIAWAEAYYGTYAGFVSETAGVGIEAVARAKGDADPVAWAQEAARRIAGESREAVKTALRSSVDKAIDSKAAVTLLLDAWQSCKASQLASDLCQLEAA